MNANEVIKGTLDTAEMVGLAYLGDLSDAQLMQRPHPECHHLNWQVGHLILSEHGLMQTIAPGGMPELPSGFAATYSKEAAASDDASKFATKEQLLQAYREQRAGTLALLAKITETELDEPSGVEYAPTKGAVFSMTGQHWLMHCGQWVIVRRQAGKPVVI
ncbi:MAG: DinB family protein [Planctomycetales bacterium]|nr:DinB family protein [Planctomycetales bacterium]